MYWFWLKLPKISDIPNIPKSITKSVINYIFNFLIGSYINLPKNIINDDNQSNVNLHDIDLNLNTLNAQLTSSPIEATKSSIGGLRLQIPWSNLFYEPVDITIDNFELTLKPSIVKVSSNNESEYSLNQSIEALTDNFIHDSNPHLDIPGSFDVPTNSEDDQMPQKSMLKTLINIILAKLCIKIYNIKINLELNEYESVFEFKVDNVLYGDVNIQEVDLERKLSIKGFEVNVHTFFNDKFSSQMFMSAVESVHGETNENGNHSTYRVLKCLDEITLKAKDNDYPQIDVDFGRIRSIICPSTVSAFLQLINELPEKTPTTISPNDNQSLFNLTNFKVFIQSIDVLILFNEPSEIPNGNNFWLSSNDYNLSDFHLYFHFNNIYINTKPSFELEVGDSSIMAIDKNKKLPILVFDEMIGESIRNDNDKRMSDWLNEDDHVNLFDKTSWHLLDSNNQTKKPEVTLSASNNIVNISPIHVFIDLMIVETFFNSDLFKSLDCLSTNNSEATYQSAINTLLDESFKNDYGNDRSHLKISDVLNPTTRIPFELLINAIRISVRCPPPTESNKLRSGILVIDGESLKITPKSQPSFSSTTISLKSVNVYWLDTQVNDRKLLKIAMIKDEEIESSLEILKRISLPPVLKFNLPFISFRFSRSTVIGLQYLADDLTKFGERIRKLTDKKEDLIGSTIEMIKSRLIVNEKEKGEDVDVENMEDFFDFNDKDNENKYLNHNLENADVEVDLKNGVYSIEVPTIDHEGKTQEDIVTLVAKAKDLKLHAKFGINDHHSKVC